MGRRRAWKERNPSWAQRERRDATARRNRRASPRTNEELDAKLRRRRRNGGDGDPGPMPNLKPSRRPRRSELGRRGELADVGVGTGGRGTRGRGEDSRVWPAMAARETELDKAGTWSESTSQPARQRRAGADKRVETPPWCTAPRKRGSRGPPLPSRKPSARPRRKGCVFGERFRSGGPAGQAEETNKPHRGEGARKPSGADPHTEASPRVK
jgi:hypothetical protein